MCIGGGANGMALNGSISYPTLSHPIPIYPILPYPIPSYSPCPTPYWLIFINTYVPLPLSSVLSATDELSLSVHAVVIPKNSRESTYRKSICDHGVNCIDDLPSNIFWPLNILFIPAHLNIIRSFLCLIFAYLTFHFLLFPCLAFTFLSFVIISN